MKRALVYRIYLDKTIKKIENKFRKLGIYDDKAVVSFLNTRLLLTILVFVLVLVLFKFGYILAPLSAIVFYLGYEILRLDYPIKRRGKKLEKEAAFFFEVLVLTLEGGRNLKRALDLTVENVDSEIALEFKKVITEVNLGKSLNEALESMKKRMPSEVINNAILNMIESNTYGNSIIDSMYNQIDYLRNKQILDVKAEISKLPVKISIISVIFFIPIMLIIILGPVLINYLLS